MGETGRVRCEAGSVYTVREGDTFADIAGRYGLTAGGLAELNPYTDIDRLSVGQPLCVPSDDGETLSEEEIRTEIEAEAANEADCPEGYAAGTVQAGESYADLLRRYDISYLAFRLANPRLVPAALREGQRYCVPPEDMRRFCPGGARSYVVGSGKTLDSLAEKLGVSPGRLLRLNPALAPGDFREGQAICLTES